MRSLKPFFLCLPLLFSACSNGLEELIFHSADERFIEMEETKDPVSLTDSLTQLPFCEETDHVLFSSFTRPQGSESSSFDICVASQKVEFRRQLVSAGVTVSYLQQAYYLADFDYEDFLAQMATFKLKNEGELVQDPLAGTCLAEQDLRLQDGSDEQVFLRVDYCSGLEIPTWETVVQGDFDSAVRLVEGLIPQLDELLSVGEALPYPGDAGSYWSERGDS